MVCVVSVVDLFEVVRLFVLSSPCCDPLSKHSELMCKLPTQCDSESIDWSGSVCVGYAAIDSSQTSGDMYMPPELWKDCPRAFNP